MFVKDELIQFINEKMVNYDPENRIKVILSYYGFIDGSWPNIRDVGRQYTASKNTKNPGTRPGQIIMAFKKLFRSLKSLEQCEILLLHNQFISTDQYSKELHNAHLIELYDPTTANIRGILELLNLTGACKEYKIYKPSLQPIQRKSFNIEEKTYLINNSLIGKLKTSKSKAYSLPGTVGLANFSYLKKLDIKYFDEVCKLIQADQKNVVIEHGGETYYFVENEKNTFIQSMGKIFNGVASQVKIDELAKSLYRSFKRRGKIVKGKHPNTDVIKAFLTKYKKIKANRDFVVFQGRKQPLEKLDKAVKSLLTKKPNVESTELSKNLKNLKFKQSYIEKLRYSPLIQTNIDDTGRFRFALIGSSDYKINKIEDHDEKVSNYSNDDLEREQKKNRETGLKGEKIIKEHLKLMKRKNKIKKFIWTSEKKVNANHDFKVIEINGSTTYIEVKSTNNEFEDNFYISYNELRKAKNETNYQIYRVYKMNDTKARLRISESITEFARNILDTFKTNEVLEGIIPASLSVSPDTLDFEKEKRVNKL